MASDVAMPIEAIRAIPTIRKHIDGPVLRWAGRMHWLTVPERMSVWFGTGTAESIADKVWPGRQATLSPASTDPLDPKKWMD